MTLEVTQDGAAVSNDDILSGDPAVLISGDDVRFTNADGGSLRATTSSAAVRLEGVGTTFVNSAGADIRSLDLSPGMLALTGSSGSETIVNEGMIIGKVLLGDGADDFTQRGMADNVDMGAGDDAFTVDEPDFNWVSADGGVGFDRILLTGEISQIFGYEVTGFEQLEVGPGVQNAEGFSGFTQVVLRPGSSVNFIESANRAATLSLVADEATGWGGSVGLSVGSVFRSIAGSASGDRVNLNHGARIERGVALGAGDDVFSYNHWVDFGNAPSIGGAVLGGWGEDRIQLSVDKSRLVDLSAFTGFEILDTGRPSSVTGRVQVTGADGFTLIQSDYEGWLRLTDSYSPDAVLSAGWGSSVTLDADVTIGSLAAVPMPYVGEDFRHAVRIVNQGHVLGDVSLSIESDYYDGRLGRAGGIVAGLAGDDILLGGAGRERLAGGAGADQIEGGRGNDLLDGGEGVDQMTGGGGNDVYTVDSSADAVMEAASGGTDRVESAISYTLGDTLEHLTLTGEAALDGTGNALANTILGNAGANQIDGRGGADRMAGGGGDDRYRVDHQDDVVAERGGEGRDSVTSRASHVLGNNVEELILAGDRVIDGTGNALGNALYGNAGANVLAGAGGADTISGGLGNDRLHGGAQADQLRGGGGADRFVFDTALARVNVDELLDFSVADDRIALDRAVFGGIAADGRLNASAFRAGREALDATDRILYDAAEGRIYYDADGSGAGSAILFAEVRAGLALTNADFTAYSGG
jgi:Ca2+-binding RTX toxin-like protein